MTLQRWFVATAFVAATCALAGLGALAAGATSRFGTATAGERHVALVAALLGFLAACLLLALSALRADVLGRTTAAAGSFIAALAFSVPAVQAFSVSVSTPSDDSSGCGSLSTPTKQLLPGRDRPEVTDTCGERLRLQKGLVLALALPTVASAATGLALGLRTGRRNRLDDRRVPGS